jgi:NADPH:quinone reductase-like Zn-dependent oxidoreductase
MKRVSIHEYGGPEQLVYEDAEVPVAGPGQLLVKVAASSVNPADWKIRSGATRAMMDFPMPLVLGGDIAGTVAAVGEGVSGWAVGDEVFALLGLVGAYAEYVAVNAAIVARKPAGLSFEEAAALPLVALTAWQALAADGRELKGKHVLVHNASGGVGSVAVQLAKAAGARVTATASAKNAAFVRGLGADVVVDFRESPVGAVAKDVDILLDCVGNSAAFGLWPLVRAGGSMIRLGGGADDAAPAEAAGVRILKMRVRPDAAQLGEIAALVDAGKLRPVVGEVVPLAEVAKAHVASQGGHVFGKIVLKM